MQIHHYIVYPLRNTRIFQKPLKYVWCGLDTYFVCRVCIDSNNKPINLNLKIMGVNGVGKKLFSKRHGANQFSLGKNNRSKVLKLPKYQRKEPTQIEIRENTGKTSNFNQFIYSWRFNICHKQAPFVQWYHKCTVYFIAKTRGLTTGGTPPFLYWVCAPPSFIRHRTII